MPVATLDLIINTKDANSGRVAASILRRFEAISKGSRGSGKGKRGPFDVSGSDVRGAIDQLGAGSRKIVEAPLELAANFEAGVNRLNALSGGQLGQTGQLDLLSKKALELGANTEFTATQSIEAFQLLQQAGLGYEEQLNSISTVLNLASVGQQSMAKTADLLTSTMSGFGLEGAGAAERVGNVLARTANSTNASVADVAGTMKKVGPAAKSLGLDIESVSVAVSALGKGAIRNGEAGNALKSIFADLSTLKGDRRKAALKAMGLTRDDVRAAMESGDFGNVLKLISDGMLKKGITSTKRIAVLEALFGKFHYVKFDTLLQSYEAPKGSEKSWENLKAKVNDTSVTLEKSAGIIRSGTKAEFIKLKSALENLGITVGTRLLPIVTPMIMRFTQWAGEVSTWASKNKELVGALAKLLIGVAAFGAVAGPVLSTLTSLAILTKLAGLGAVKGAAGVTKMGGAMSKLTGVGNILFAAMAGWSFGTFLDDALGISNAIAKVNQQVSVLEGKLATKTRQKLSFRSSLTNEERDKRDTYQANIDAATAELQAIDDKAWYNTTPADNVRRKELQNQVSWTQGLIQQIDNKGLKRAEQMEALKKATASVLPEQRGRVKIEVEASKDLQARVVDVEDDTLLALDAEAGVMAY